MCLRRGHGAPPLTPHFYIVKLGFTEVYMFFLFLLLNIDCGYSLEPPHWGGSNVYPQSMLWAKIRKIIIFFYLKIFNFTAVKNRCILHGHVIVMILAGYEDNYKSLDGFKFRQNSTADFGVGCPWASEKKRDIILLALWCLNFWSDLLHSCRYGGQP